jgi:COP9 signalosome complex subunit 4
VNAEKYINKATNLVDTNSMDKDLVTRFKFCKARVLDSKRLFILASIGYYDLSHSAQLAEEGMIECLNNAVICAILAPPSPKKMIVLKTLIQDE